VGRMPLNTIAFFSMAAKIVNKQEKEFSLTIGSKKVTI
jgi:hypothetical protein